MELEDFLDKAVANKAAFKKMSSKRAAATAPAAPAAALRACFEAPAASRRGGGLLARHGSGPGPRPALVALVLLSIVFVVSAGLRPAPAPAGGGVAAAAGSVVQMRRLMPVPVEDAVAAEVEIEERLLQQEYNERDIAAYEERPVADGEGGERDALTARLDFAAAECAAREPELLQRVGAMLHAPYMMDCARGPTPECCAGLQSEASPWHGCTCAAETVWKALQAVPGFVRPLVKSRLTQCGVPLPGAGCPGAAAEEAEVGEGAGVQLEGPEADAV